VPASMRDDGVPFGITLIGPAGSDLVLADLGQRFHLSTGLPLGALGIAAPAAEALVAAPAAARIAVVGAHLTGLPLNGELVERGARLVRTARTAPNYRLYFLISVLAASSSPFPSAPFALASPTQPSVTYCTSGFQLSISLLEMLLMLLAGRRARTSVSASAKMRPIWPESAMPLFAHRSPCVRDLHGAVLG